MSFKMTAVFPHGADIPAKYRYKGDNIPPPLEWINPPHGTNSFALIVDDPDAPGNTWVHWLVYNLHFKTCSLPESGVNGVNSWGELGYRGPCPASGIHRYFFKLYTLDYMLDLPSGLNKNELDRAMTNHMLGRAWLMGLCRSQ